MQFRHLVWAACGAFMITATAAAQDEGVEDDFVRSPSQSESATTPDDPVNPSFERPGNESSSGLSNDWIRDQNNRPTESEPVPMRREPPEEKGLERAEERANENADDGLDRAAERAADEELDRVERERDRPGIENRSARAADEDDLDTEE